MKKNNTSLKMQIDSGKDNLFFQFAITLAQLDEYYSIIQESDKNCLKNIDTRIILWNVLCYEIIRDENFFNSLCFEEDFKIPYSVFSISLEKLILESLSHLLTSNNELKNKISFYTEQYNLKISQGNQWQQKHIQLSP